MVASIMNNVRNVRINASDATTVINGLFHYYRRGEVEMNGWRALLNLHCRTNGQFTDRLAAFLRLMRRPRPAAPVSGILGHLSVERQREIVATVRRDGCYIFPDRLSPSICDAMADFARRTPAVVEGGGRNPEDMVLFNPAAPLSKTYRIRLEEILSEPAMQHMMADPSLLAIAEMYLKTYPILGGVDLWWSPTFGDEPGDGAAQLFHFDFDPPPAWLHFFVYLTDVGPENGPHVYARGSHLPGHPAAAALRARGYVRISDREIAQAFGADSIVELCGPRGTILAVDTRGFHKGKMPTAGHRLISQFIYCSAPYNVHSPKMKLPAAIVPELRDAISRTPRVFEMYT